MKAGTYEVELKGYGVLVDVDYVPYRPAPYCQNHDSPAFSDPGDDEEFNVTHARTAKGEDLDDLIESLDGWDRLAEIARAHFDTDDDGRAEAACDKDEDRKLDEAAGL